MFRKPHKVSVPSFLCSHWSIFPVYIHIKKPACGTIFRITGRVREQLLETHRRLSESRHKLSLVSDFIESSRNFIFDSLSFTKRELKIVKTKSAYSKNTASIFRQRSQSKGQWNIEGLRGVLWACILSKWLEQQRLQVRKEQGNSTLTAVIFETL